MPDDDRLNQVSRRLESFFTRADDTTQGWLGTLRTAVDNFTHARGTHASAAVAYYAMFSLFPMLMVLVILLSYLVDTATAREVVLEVIARFLPNDPGIETLVTETFFSVYSMRSQVGLISLVALLWSASGAFTTLTFNIDLAWNLESRPNPVKARLIGLLMVILLFAALLLTLVLSTMSGVFSALPTLFTFLGIDPEVGRLGTLQVISVGVTILVYTGLYRWIPKKYVPWRAALIPAVLGGLVSQLFNRAYSWYLGSGLAAYEFLYGPLTTIIVLMFWFYLTVLVILVGAHLGAAIARRMAGTPEVSSS